MSFSPVKNVGYYSVAVVSTDINNDNVRTVFSQTIDSNPSQRQYTVDCTVNLEKDHIYYVYATANLTQNGVDSTASDYYMVMVYGPSQLSAETTADGVRLSVPDYKGEYEVYRSTDGKRWTKVRATVEDSRNWCAVDKTARVGTTYQYKVRATLPYADLCISEDSDVVTCKHLAGPTLQPLENTAAGVRLVWTKAQNTTDECEYYIYRRKWGSDFEFVGSTSGTSYEDNNLTANTFYEYRIAQITSTETRYSTVRRILHMKPVSLSSENCRFTASNKAFVSWNYDGPVSGAEIRYRDGSLVRIVKPRNSWYSAEIIGLSNKKTYQISVRLYYKEGLVTYYSDWSNEVTLSP